MSGKLYHWILFITSVALLVYWAGGMLFHDVKWLNLSISGKVEDILALFILYVQTSYASKFIQRSNAALSFLAVVGCLFALQHWPYGRILFLSSFALIIVLLLIDSSRHKARRGVSLCIMAFPAIHLLVIAGYIYRLHSMFLLDLLASGIVVIGVGRSLLRR